MKDIGLTPAFTIPKTCVVISDTFAGNIVRVVMSEAPQGIPEFQINATVINPTNIGNPTIPTKGTIGLVLLDPKDKTKGYWIGKIRNPETEENTEDKVSNKQGEITVVNDKGSGLKISDDSLSIANDKTNITSDDSGLKFIRENSSLSLGDNKFEINGKDYNFKITNGLFNLHSAGEANISGVGGVNLLTKGSLIISSGLYNSEEKDFLKSLGSINRFIVKCSESRISTGSAAVIDAGSLTLNVCSGKIAGGDTPGKGSSQSFLLSVVQGDGMLSFSSGNLNITTLGLSNYVKIRAGKLQSDVAYSEIKLTREAFQLNSEPLTVQLKGSKGNLEGSARKDIKFNSDMNFTVKSTMASSISAQTNVELKADVTIKLEGTTSIECKGTQLKMTDVNIIDAGDKTVLPTGTGPFCAITICPLTYQFHVGSKAMG